MGYYARGDYYGRGDYYNYAAGGFLGGLGRALIGGVKGFITGGPVGAAVGVAATALKPKPTGAAVPTPATLSSVPQINPPAPGFQPGVGIQVSDVFRFGAFGPPVGGGGGMQQAPVGTMTPQGFIPGLCGVKGTHPNRSSYYKAVPGNPMTAVLIPKGSVCVKNRRINVANPRALRRALRRAAGFAKLARRVMVGPTRSFKKSGIPKRKRK